MFPHSICYTNFGRQVRILLSLTTWYKLKNEFSTFQEVNIKDCRTLNCRVIISLRIQLSKKIYISENSLSPVKLKKPYNQWLQNGHAL